MIRQLYVIYCLLLRDFQLFLSDKRAVLISFIVPILLASAFGVIFDQPAEQLSTFSLPLAIDQRDHHPWTDQIISNLKANSHLKISMLNEQESQNWLKGQRLGVMLQIPTRFHEIKYDIDQQLTHSRFAILQANKSFQKQQNGKLSLYHHPLSRIEAVWIEGIITEILLKQLGKDWLGTLGVSDKVLQSPFEFEILSNQGNQGGKFHSYSHCFGGMSLQYLLFWGMEAGLLFLRERHHGIWHRLRTMPVSLWQLLFSRMLSTMLIALLQMIVTFTFAYFIFSVKIHGSPLGIIILMLGMSFLASSSGLMVAAWGGNEARSRQISIFVILTISMFGGLWIPSFLLPIWIQQFAYIFPTSWVMRSWDGFTWQNLSFPDIILPLVVIYGYSVFFCALAGIRFYQLEKKERLGL